MQLLWSTQRGSRKILQGGRLGPQITVLLPTDAAGFPLSVEAFGGHQDREGRDGTGQRDDHPDMRQFVESGGFANAMDTFYRQYQNADGINVPKGFVPTG